MDKVVIRDLKIETIVGLYAWERIARQTLLLNIDLITDIRQAARDDDLQFTIDYSAVCTAVTALVQEREFQLIETLAEEVAAMIQEKFSVSGLRLAVYKMDVLTNVRRVGIEIERGDV
jgi:dihydroneopterin aldolase